MPRLITLAILSLCLPLPAQDLPLVPIPKEITPTEGTMALNVNTRILAPESLQFEASILSGALTKLTGFMHRTLSPRLKEQLTQEVLLEIDPEIPAGSYSLTIKPDAATIRGRDPETILYGIRSFIQLLPIKVQPQQQVQLPCLVITDSPSAERRIVVIDTARHLFPLDTLKWLLDWMGYHKLNELHLHLNDDQGWRLESDRHPKLFQIGATRSSTPPYTHLEGDEDPEEYAGFYSRENILELLRHARQRHITIIPGFSLPTHASAILAAYPELGNTDLPDYQPGVKSTWGTFPDTLALKDETLAFLDTLFAEVASVFPAPEIRIHAPDVPWTQWEQSPAAQAVLKSRNLDSAGELRDAFLTEIDTLLAKHERKRFDPKALPSLDLSTYQLPAAPELEEDPHREAFKPLVSLKEAQQTRQGKTMQAIVWTQLIHSPEKLQYQLFPRLAGFAEAAWSAPSAESYPNFLARLQPILEHYRNSDINLGEVHRPLTREALQGTTITTTLSHAGDHWPELAFDGNGDSSFQSDGGLKTGDHFTFNFAFPVHTRISVSTGGEESEILEHGVLEAMIDGEVQGSPATFNNGIASVDLPRGTRQLRLTITRDQATPLIIDEIVLSEPLLPPVVTDIRGVEFPSVDEDGSPVKAHFKFEGDFAKHPEVRPQFQAMRKRFFHSAPRAAFIMGLAGKRESFSFKIIVGEDTSLNKGILTVKAGELQKLNTLEAEELALFYLITHLQNYPKSAPAWFTSGLNTFIRFKELPDLTWAKTLLLNADRSKALEGGANSASFLDWLVKTYNEVPLTNASLSFRKGLDNPHIWRGSTGGKTLEDLVREYQQ